MELATHSSLGYYSLHHKGLLQWNYEKQAPNKQYWRSRRLLLYINNNKNISL